MKTKFEILQMLHTLIGEITPRVVKGQYADCGTFDIKEIYDADDIDDALYNNIKANGYDDRIKVDECCYYEFKDKTDDEAQRAIEIFNDNYPDEVFARQGRKKAKVTADFSCMLSYRLKDSDDFIYVLYPR